MVEFIKDVLGSYSKLCNGILYGVSGSNRFMNQYRIIYYGNYLGMHSGMFLMDDVITFPRPIHYFMKVINLDYV